MPAGTMDGDCPAWSTRFARVAEALSGNHKKRIDRISLAFRPVARLMRRGPSLGVLAVALVVALAGRVDAGYRELDEGWRLAAEGRVDAAWTSDVFATADDPEASNEKPAFADAGVGVISASNSQTRPAQAGEFIDRYWYELADKWQYYYLDQGQYNLLGGLSYLLGHPCYPKLFERPMDQAVGFDGRVHVFWYGICSYLPVEGGYAWLNYGPDDSQWFASVPWPAWDLPFSSGGLLFAQTAGDYLDRWRYKYMDLGQYRYLDTRQYNLLGGLGYMFGRVNYGWTRDSIHMWQRGGWSDYHHAPEPGTITLLAFGALSVIRRRLRGCGPSKKHC